MPDKKRIFEPVVLETKQEILTALKTGQIQASKYHLLSESQKMFVELVAFGDYTPTQAIKVLDPSHKNPTVAGNRLMMNKEVNSVIEELTMLRNKKFMAEVSSARDMALAKLKYIMSTTEDPALAAACAKTILDKAEKALEEKVDDTGVGQVRFNIQVENMYAGGLTQDKNEPIIITIDDQQSNDLNKQKNNLQSEVHKLNAEVQNSTKASVNPDTGLPYTISYEGVDMYSKKKEPTE